MISIDDYREIQLKLDNHLERIIKYGKKNRNYIEIYKEAIMAAKSVISNFNPENKNK